MRMWMLPPENLCRRHLLGEHVELHMLMGHLRRGRRLGKFVAHNCVEPQSVVERHRLLVAEFKRRGYYHHSPLTGRPRLDHLTLEEREARVDRIAAAVDLLSRCPACGLRNFLNTPKKRQQKKS